MQKNKKRFFFTPGLEKLPPHIAVELDKKCTSEAWKRWQLWAAIILVSTLPMILSEFVQLELGIGAVFTGVAFVIVWKYIAASIAKVEIEKLRKEAEIDGTELENIPPPLDGGGVKAHDEISKFQLKGGFLFMFVFFPISAVLCFGILFPIHHWYLSTLEQGVFTLVTETSRLWLLACFPGIPTGYFLYYFYVKKYHPLVAENERKTSLKSIGFILVFLCYASPFLLIDFYTVFTNDEILHNSVLSYSKVRYPYDQVTEIRSFTDKEDQDWLFVIWFADGEYWSSNNVFDELSDSEKRKLAAFVSKKSGKDIREVEDIKETKRRD